MATALLQTARRLVDHRPSAARLTALLLLLLAVPTLLSIPTLVLQRPVEVGQPAPRTILAPETVEVADTAATDRAISDALSSVPPVYRFDPQAQQQAVSRIRNLFEAVEQVREPIMVTPPAPSPEPAPSPSPGEPTPAPQPVPEPSPTPQEPDEATQRTDLADALQELPFDNIDTQGIRLLVELTDSELDTLEGRTVAITRQIARQRIREDQRQTLVADHLQVELALRHIDEDLAEHVVEPAVTDVVGATVVIDEEATESERQQAADNVEPVVRTFEAGTSIVVEGQTVTDVQAAALADVNLGTSDPAGKVAATFGLAWLLLAAAAAYLWQFKRDIVTNPRLVLLLVSLTTAAAATIGLLSLFGTGLHTYLIPVAAFTMLTCVMVGAGTATVLTIVVAVLGALVAPGGASFGTYAAAAGLAAIPTVDHLAARTRVRAATLPVIAIHTVAASAAAAAHSGIDQVPQAALIGAGAGLIAAVLASGLLPLLESMFKVTTDSALMDLADRNHPLLRKLESKALGTYNHSVTVATIAERACRKIGANALLCSVMALYHDIGKTERPQFFIENQRGVNPHDELNDPQASAEIIHAHVSDGVHLAQHHGLPPDVTDGIACHHGTMLVKYFHHQAIETAKQHGELTDQQAAQLDDTFRYPGPKPTSREHAVLMLSDCCESAARATAVSGNGTLTGPQIQQLVDSLIQARLDDNQLDDTDLSLRDLRVVTDTIIESLKGIYHPRIAYPDDSQQDGTQQEGGGEQNTTAT